MKLNYKKNLLREEYNLSGIDDSSQKSRYWRG